MDGIYGPLTEKAVRQAQAGLGLEVDGLAGRETVAALQQRVAGQAESGGTSLTKAVTAIARSAGKSGLIFFAATDTSATPSPAPAAAGPPSVDAPEGGVPTAESPAAPAAKPQQQFALTFNGTPDPQLAPILLETLKRHGMQATFFIQGEAAEANAALLRQIVAEGHEIGNHGLSGQEMTSLTEAAARAQLKQAQRAITAASGKAPRFFRPPQGRFSSQLAALAREAEMELVLWTNVTVRDLPELEPALLAAQLQEQVYPGAVLMLHQDRAATVAALEPLLKRLREQGYVSVGLSGLVAGTN